MTLLRAARSTDAGAVGAILSEFAKKTAWLPRVYSGAQDIAHAGHMIERGGVVVAERRGTVVGFVDRDGLEIDALYVAHGLRGQGIGAVLLAHARACAPRLNLWTYQANAAAIAFYRKHGFVETSRTDGMHRDEQLPDVWFEWKKEAA